MSEPKIPERSPWNHGRPPKAIEHIIQRHYISLEKVLNDRIRAILQDEGITGDDALLQARQVFLRGLTLTQMARGIGWLKDDYEICEAEDPTEDDGAGFSSTGNGSQTWGGKIGSTGNGSPF